MQADNGVPAAPHHAPNINLVVLSYSTFWRNKGAIIFFGRGFQIFQKSASIKLRPPLFRQQKFYDTPPPRHQYTLPLKQAKIVLKSVFLNKINTLSVGILRLPTFWLSKILWPPYFSFIFFPQYIWDPPFQRKW